MMRFADGGIVGLANGGRPGGMDLTPQDYADYMSDAQRTVGRTNYDNAMAEETARQIAAPQVGVRRSNIIQSRDYDPQYAQALNISQGLLPGNTAESVKSILGPSRFQKQFPQGIQSLSRPTDLIPQYDKGKYFSPYEKALMEPEGLISLLMPGGFIKPFMESKLMKSIMGSDLVQGAKNINFANMYPFAENYGARTTTYQPTPVKMVVTPPPGYGPATYHFEQMSKRPYREEQLIPRREVNRGYGITELLDVPYEEQIQRNLPSYQRKTFNAPEFLYELRGLAKPEVDANPFTYGGQKFFPIHKIRNLFGGSKRQI